MWVLSLLLFYFLGGEITVKDLDGRTVDALGARTTVLIFTRTDCPISNRYAPEVRRIYEAFSNRADFWLVYVDPKQTAETVRAHVREYGYPFGALLDGRHELVKLAGASITPEAAVFAGRKLIYRGRIDDRYVTFGKARQTATKHDLEDALAAVAAGKPAPFRETKAVGCFIEDLR